MKLLAVNVGNSRVAFGIFQDGLLTQQEHHRIGQDKTKLTEATQVWGELTIDQAGPAVLASVNPPVAELVCNALIEDVGIKVLTVGQDIPLPMKVDLPAPQKVGVDRILNAAAAYDRIKGAVAVVDAGTAITVDFVSAEGVFFRRGHIAGLWFVGSYLARGYCLTAAGRSSQAGMYHWPGY